MLKNKKGFTLIELLAVIALLAIISVIAVTRVISRSTSARKKAFLDEAKIYFKASDEIDLYNDNTTTCLNVSELNSKYISKSDSSYSGCMYVYPDGSTKLNLTNGKYYVVTNGDILESDITETKPSNFISSCSDNSKSYTITYDLDGGTVATANPTTYTSNTDTITLNNPTKAGYNFIGWSSKNLINFNVSQTTLNGVTASAVNNEITISGTNTKKNGAYGLIHWRSPFLLKNGTTYTLSVDKNIPNMYFQINCKKTAGNENGMWSVKNSTKSYSARLSNDCAYMSLAFLGVYKEANDIDMKFKVQLEEGNAATDYQDYMAPTMSAKIYRGSIGNKKFIANWEEANGNYTITYNLDGGTVSNANPTSYNVNTPTFTLNNPTKEGKLFLGWTEGTSNTLLQTVTIPQGTVGNKTYIAHFVNEKSTVTYNYNISSAQAVNYQSYIDTGFIPNTNYNFTLAAKMKINTASKRYLLFGNYPASAHFNLEINASNRSRIYITKGTNIDKNGTVNVPANEEFDLNFEYTASTYSYFYRLSNSNFTADLSGESANIKDIVMPSSLLIGNDYRSGATFTSLLNVKNIIITRDYPYDASLTDLPVVVRPGYTFDGWYTAASGGTKITTATKVTTDVTYYAHYTAS